MEEIEPHEACVIISLIGDSKILTDNYWEVYDSQGNKLDSGPKHDGRSQLVNGILLGEDYSVHLYDKTGDGLCCKFVQTFFVFLFCFF